MSKIVVETTQMFRTSDGRAWLDEAAANVHQAALDYGATIETYIDKNKAAFEVQGAAGRARGVLGPFLAWLSAQDGVTLPSFDMPATTVQENPPEA